MIHLSHHQKHSIRKWFHERGENLLDLIETANDENPCDLCDDAHKQYWYDNGYTEEERQAICLYLCPPSSEG